MPGYNGILGYAMKMIQNNPNIANNPQAQPMIDAIQRGDEQAGVELANNILQTYGLSKEQGLSIAMQKLRFPKFK